MLQFRTCIWHPGCPAGPRLLYATPSLREGWGCGAPEMGPLITFHHHDSETLCRLLFCPLGVRRLSRDRQASRTDRCLHCLGLHRKVFAQIALFVLSHRSVLKAPKPLLGLGFFSLQPHFALKGVFQIKPKLVFCFSCGPSG